MLALATLAMAANACTQTQVVLETGTIRTGDGHTCAIAAGALYCWGRNDDERLGLGSATDDRLSPERVGVDADWKDVATGMTSSLALKVNGEIWSFGNNAYGQLGLGDLDPRGTPNRIVGRSDWVAIAMRFQHACALASDGTLWCWGKNEEGQLGQSDIRTTSTERITTPVQVLPFHDYVAVDAGDGHTCAIRANGTLWCWGRNSESELGIYTDGKTNIQFREPKQVLSGEPPENGWTVVRAGQSTTCGVRGAVAYCWGSSAGMNRMGVSIPGVDQGMTVSMPTHIGDSHTAVADLSFHTFGGALLDGKGGAWVWGSNEVGELGLGEPNDPSGVVPTTESGWSQMTMGRFTTCGVLHGRPRCTGSNDNGQLGRGTIEGSNVFLPVQILQP